jgi:hypothetical protein
MVSDETMLKKEPNEPLVSRVSPNKDIIIIPKSYKYDSVLVWLHDEGSKPEIYLPLFFPAKM